MRKLSKFYFPNWEKKKKKKIRKLSYSSTSLNKLWNFPEFKSSKTVSKFFVKTTLNGCATKHEELKDCERCVQILLCTYVTYILKP